MQSLVRVEFMKSSRWYNYLVEGSANELGHPTAAVVETPYGVALVWVKEIRPIEENDYVGKLKHVEQLLYPQSRS